MRILKYFATIAIGTLATSAVSAPQPPVDGPTAILELRNSASATVRLDVYKRPDCKGHRSSIPSMKEVRTTVTVEDRIAAGALFTFSVWFTKGIQICATKPMAFIPKSNERYVIVTTGDDTGCNAELKLSKGEGETAELVDESSLIYRKTKVPLFGPSYCE